MTPTPYRISVPDEKLQELKAKLELASFPDELDDAGWQMGAPLNDVKKLVAYWKDSFDWKKTEAELNELPQFRETVPVEGFSELDIHFLHQQSEVDGAIPLLFCHGWPGSFLEVKKLLPLLKGDSKSPAFHIIAPSLPNFGFSQGVKKRGFYLSKYAETLHNLMLKLGYDKYVTQGGDWGYFITRLIADKYPKHCVAHHINMVRPVAPPSFTQHPLLALQHAILPYTDREKWDVGRAHWFQSQGSGYKTEQGTKPQTLGYSLADSPVGLLAWIYEKLHDWTDSYPWTEDEICTWISIYWFSTAGPAASVRIYYEASHEDGVDGRNEGILRAGSYIPDSKLGLLYAPMEIGTMPRRWGRAMGPVVHERELDHGGHFAAWEKPDELAGAVKEMFGKGKNPTTQPAPFSSILQCFLGGPCYGIIAGRRGFTIRASL
ncbi:MAG: hypothetical protein M1820_000598 [Bogoriella megaspora]|nr:MAG: hypothetical protein M1820_000598 [Bogoriella megaspora]